MPTLPREPLTLCPHKLAIRLKKGIDSCSGIIFSNSVERIKDKFEEVLREDERKSQETDNKNVHKIRDSTQKSPHIQVTGFPNGQPKGEERSSSVRHLGSVSQKLGTQVLKLRVPSASQKEKAPTASPQHCIADRDGGPEAPWEEDRAAHEALGFRTTWSRKQQRWKLQENGKTPSQLGKVDF